MRSAYSGSMPIPLSEQRKRQQSPRRSALRAITRRGLVAELDRVGDQVLEDEPQQPGVAVDGRQRPFDRDGGPALLDRPRQVRAHALDEQPAVDVDVRLLHAPDARERQQVVDQVLHAASRRRRRSRCTGRRARRAARRSAAAAAGRSSRPCAAAPGGRARRRRRTARARRWSGAGRPRPRAAPRARRRSARASCRRPRRGRRPRAPPMPRTSPEKSPRATSRTASASRCSGTTSWRRSVSATPATLSRITMPVPSTQKRTTSALWSSERRASARAGATRACKRVDGGPERVEARPAVVDGGDRRRPVRVRLHELDRRLGVLRPPLLPALGRGVDQRPQLARPARSRELPQPRDRRRRVALPGRIRLEIARLAPEQIAANARLLVQVRGAQRLGRGSRRGHSGRRARGARPSAVTARSPRRPTRARPRRRAATPPPRTTGSPSADGGLIKVVAPGRRRRRRASGRR